VNKDSNISIRVRAKIPRVNSIEELIQGVNSELRILRYSQHPKEMLAYNPSTTWLSGKRIPNSEKEITNLRSVEVPCMDLIAVHDASISGPSGVYFGENEACLFPFFVKADFSLSNEARFKRAIRLRRRTVSSGMSLKPKHQATLTKDISPTRVIEEPVLFFGKPSDTAYSHFIWDSIPVLWWLDQLDENVKILAVSPMPSYQKELLDAYGVPESRIIWRTKDEDVRVRKLYLASHLAVNNRWAREEGTKFLQRARKTSILRPRRRVYLDRGGDRAAVRRLINENQIFEICKKYGFERITPGDLSFHQKVELFKSCEIVVGQYGGGMQTHFLLNPGASILCLQSNMFIRDIFDFTASILGIKLVTIIGESFPRIEEKERHANNSDFFVEALVFESALKKICNTREKNFEIRVSKIHSVFKKLIKRILRIIISR
jgi:hypothetical protein